MTDLMALFNEAFLQFLGREHDNSAGERPAALFDNLFGPAIDVGVVSIEPAASDAGQFLNSLDPLDPATGVPDATEQEIENALRTSSTFDEIAVYDVGQGSANGLISNQEVVCYFDFGGGASPFLFIDVA